MSSTDWEFIFDGIFGFLSSPLWLAPISAFIEENSIGKEKMKLAKSLLSNVSLAVQFIS